MNLQHFLLSCDFNRPAQLILSDLVWLSTGYRMSLPHTTLGKPRKLDQRPDRRDDANTYIPAEIDASWDGEFPGDNGFLYYRVPIAWATQGKTLEITQALPYTTHQVLAEVNAQLGLQLTTQDVVNESYTTAEQVFGLKAHPHSLVWCDAPLPEMGPYSLTWLDHLDLKGLVYVQPVDTGGGDTGGGGGNPPPNDGLNADFIFWSTDYGYAPDPNFIF